MLLLRYHHDHGVNEISAALGIAPNIATKRLTRAIERLRKFMTDRGANVSGAVVAEVFTRMSREPTPLGFSSTVAAVATGVFAPTAAVHQITKGLVYMFRTVQIKLAAGVMVVVLLGSGGIVAIALLGQRSPHSFAEKSPATQPATTTQKLVARSPKEALTLFAKASRDVDVDGMKSLVHIAEPKEESLLLGACDLSTPTRRFWRPSENASASSKPRR